MSLNVDKKMRDLAKKLDKFQLDIDKLNASINQNISSSVSIVATGSSGDDPVTSHAGLDAVQGNGDIHLSDNEKSNLDFFNSSFVEQFDFKVTSNGTVITGSLEKTGTGDLTMQFDNQATTILDCTPALTKTITAGTDTTPVYRYYYILESAKTIITEGTDWPSAEHIKVARLNVPSAAFIQTKNVYSNQNINNMRALVAGDLSGMGVHLGHKIRESIGATYKTVGGGLAGAAGSGEYLDVSGGTTVRFKMDIGVVMQMHDHTFNAVDTSSGDVVLVRNFSGTAWNDISNIYDIVNDSTGASINNKYFNIIVVAIASKETDYVMINTPGGSYSTLAKAVEDKDRFDDYTIPIEFKGVSTLICRMVIRKAASAWVVHQIDDLRGTNPAVLSGAPVTGGYSDADVEAYVNSVANAPIATGDSLVFTDVGSSGVLKQDLVSDLVTITDAAAIVAVEAADPLTPLGAIHNTVDGKGFYTGAGDDLRLFHDGNSQLISTSGFLRLRNAFGNIDMLTAQHFFISDDDDSDIPLFDFDTSARTLKIGVAADIVDLGLGMTPTVQLELSLDEGQKPTTNTWTITPSGRDFKQNIEDYTLGLATLMNIRPRQFKYKAIYDQEKTHDMEKTHVGIIAEEMELVMPSTIGTGKKNYNFRPDPADPDNNKKEIFDTVDTYTYNSHEVLYVMINAIKEQQVMIDDLRTEIDILKGAK